MVSERTKFYRDKKNGYLMGVCAGLEDYTGIDAIWWRIAFVLLIGTSFGIPLYLLMGIFASKKPQHLYVDQAEQKYWQGVRQSPKRTAREIRAQFRDIDRRLANVEHHYVASNQRLSAEIERLR